ncbi:MAG: type transport system permease protein [Pyrococcus sp.]|uniref:multidrug transporter n=1 Tax=Pyrococcus sp. TaxID=33866 RepID=UPI00258A58ED|nr:multidrug transporter [Pyrococcus sp.]MDK2869655.1 type transport system permease protein [Pyrococcus sp.]
MSILAIMEYYKNALMKSKSSMLSFAIQPLSFIFIVYVISGGKFLSSALAGAIVSFIVGVGMADLPIELVGMKVRSKFYDIIMSLPGNSAEKMLGISLGISLPAMPYLAILVIMLLAKLGLHHIKYIVLSIVSLWIWSVTIGMYIGVKIKEPLTVMRLSTVLTTVLTIFLPVYYPINLVPKSLQPFLLAVPTVSASHLMASNSPHYAELSAVSLMLWVVLCLILTFFVEIRE